MAKLVDRIESRAKALQLGQTSTQELYQQALIRANQELGRVSGQLAAENRRLAVRAQFFDALSAFQGELRPDAPPQMVLRAIGQTAVGVLGVRCVAAFSLMPGQDFAEVLLFDEAGDIFESSLVDCPSGRRSARAATGRCCTPGTNWTGFCRRFRRGWWATSDSGSASGPRDLRRRRRLGRSRRRSAAARHAGAGTDRHRRRLGAGLRTAQIREEARALAEQLAEANRRLQSAQNEILHSQNDDQRRRNGRRRGP